MNVNQIHNKAFKKAKKKLPKKSIVEILEKAYKNRGEKELKQIALEVALEYKAFGKEYLKQAAVLGIDEALKNSDNEFLKSLGKEKIGKALVDSSAKVFKTVRAYMKQDISEEQLVTGLYQKEFKELMTKIMKELNLDAETIQKNPGSLVNVTWAAISYNAFMGAYKELQKAYNDLELAREERIRIEAECGKAVDCIVEARKEMEERVSAYLSEHLEAFETGFAMMDQAILENDTEGFIKGNVEIQKMLGYDVQFTNQEEFDLLMESDESFKL